jgi:hypothetical protein
MDADTLRRGVTALGPCLCALADAGARNSGMGRLRVIGIEAEAAMLGATAALRHVWPKRILLAGSQYPVTQLGRLLDDSGRRSWVTRFGSTVA